MEPIIFAGGIEPEHRFLVTLQETPALFALFVSPEEI
jgi:hypothetical protein